jgi:hypothetical protein
MQYVLKVKKIVTQAQIFLFTLNQLTLAKDSYTSKLNRYFKRKLFQRIEFELKNSMKMN